MVAYCPREQLLTSSQYARVWLGIFTILLLPCIISKESKKASCSTAQTKARCLNKVEFHILYDKINPKDGFSSLCAENSGIQQLSSHQLELLKKCIEVLGPIEEVTRSISVDLASVSIITLYICILTRTLEKNTDDSGICTMKGELLHSLKSRFSGIEEKKELSLATFLDPRFKYKFFQAMLLLRVMKTSQ